MGKGIGITAAALLAAVAVGSLAAAHAPQSGGSSAPATAGHGMMRGGHHWQRGVMGLVGTVSGSGFTVSARGTTYTVTVGKSTTYSYGRGLTAAAGLGAVQSHERVMVAGTISGTDVTATAVHIQLPSERGQVTAVSGSELTVQEGSSRQAIVDISGVANPPTVTPYEEVAAAGTWTSTDTSGVADTLDAEAVAVVPAQFGGTLTSVSGTPGASGTATVRTGAGRSVTVSWTSATTFRSITFSAAGKPPTTSTPTSLSTGQMIRAQGQWSGVAGAAGSTFNATRITVLPASVPGRGGRGFGPGAWLHAGAGHPGSGQIWGQTGPQNGSGGSSGTTAA